MRCPSCDHENLEGSRFCNACGAPLARVCGSCDQSNPPDARFCNRCGAGLAEEPAAASARDPRDYTPPHLAEKILRGKSALEGERKQVTVLFADLADSTALASLVGPEEMHTLLDEAFQRILREVHTYEGTVNQFTGDGVMALFGAPLAIEGAPRAAVAAALAIQRSLAELDETVQQRHGARFRMRIGIHSGPVVVGAIGDDLRMDYTAIGDTTHLAARMEALAAPGAVWISQATERLVAGWFELADQGAREVKGRGEPLRVFEVLARRPVQDRLEALPDAALTPWVGRARELDALVGAFEAARAGHGQCAFVVGEAGVGKSRLLREFRATLASQPHRWVEGRCTSYARDTPFHAIVDALRRRSGIDDRDDEASALAKLEAHESRLGGDLGWTLPFVRRLLSLPSGDPTVDALDPLTRRAETCKALLARFLRAGHHEPLVLVIEDLHWIDSASEEFLAFLNDSVAAARVLMVLTHRPGYRHPFGDRSFHLRIPVRPLSEVETARIIEGMLGSDALPGSIAAFVDRRAEGNPLFVEELVHSLLEEGVLTREEGRIALTRDLAGVSVPDRIQDVLMARLDRLAEDPKRALQVASVIGREFAFRLLSRISESAEPLEEIVGELRALELIHEKSAYPELAYMFKHALTHDVAYESLLVARRKELHHLVGRAIEELYPDRLPEHYEALAHHFGAAEDWEKTFLYHERAADKSASAYANRAAVEHCRAALGVADRASPPIADERCCALHRLAAGCAWSLSRFEDAAESFLRAAELEGDPAQAALDRAYASFCLLWAHQYEASQDLATRALAEAGHAAGAAALAVAEVSRDEWDLVVHGRGLDDEDRIERALGHARRSGRPAVEVLTLGHSIQRAEWRADYPRAIEIGESARTLAEREGILGESLFAQWFLGIAYVATGRYTDGFRVLGDGLALSNRIGDRALQARLLNTFVWALAEIGCHQRASSLNRLGAEIGREMVEQGLVAGAPELYANAAVNLAGNLVALGATDEAAEVLAPVQADLATSDDPWMRWRYALHVEHAAARIELARGHPERALERLAVEVDGARRFMARKIEARALELRARALVHVERHEEAAEALRAASALAEEIAHPPVLWRAHSLLAELAGRAGRAPERERHEAIVRKTVGATLREVTTPELRADFERLASALIEDPLGAHR